MNALLDIFKRIYALLENRPIMVLSLHFGTDAVRMALFSRTGEGWTLADYKISSSTSPPNPSAHIEEIRSFLRTYASGRIGLILTWKADFIEKPVVLPDMPPAEIEAAVRFAMEHHFSIQLDECLFAAIPSVEIASGQGMNTRQYFIFATPKQDAKRYLDLMAGLPVLPLAITPSSIAAAELVAPPSHEKDLGILSIDSEGASFQIFRKGKPLISRPIAVSLRAFAPALLGIATGAWDLPVSGVVPDEGSGGKNLEAIQKVRPYLERLMSGLQSSIDFYHQQSFSGEIEKIYLIEDGDSLPDLPKILEESIEMPVLRPELALLGELAPTALAAEELKSRWIQLLPAIGAFVVWKNRGMNLMPQDILFRVASGAKVKWLKFGAFVLGALCLFLLAYAFITGGLQKQRLEVLHISEKSAVELQQLSQKSVAARGFQTFASRSELPVPVFLKLLSHETPDGVIIYDIAYDREAQKFELNGGALASTGDPVGLSAKLVKALASSPFFSKAELVEGSRDPKSNAYRFKIVAVMHDSI